MSAMRQGCSEQSARWFWTGHVLVFLIAMVGCGGEESEGPSACPGNLVRNETGNCVPPTSGGNGDPNATCDPSLATVLRINEVFIRPSGPNGENEFVEISGPPGARLNGYVLTSVSGAQTARTGFRVVLNGTVNANGLYVVGGTAVSNLDQAHNCTTGTGCVFNDGNSMILRGCDGQTLVDGVSWGNFSGRVNRADQGEPAPLPPEGSTLARCPGRASTGDNKRDFGVASPTPGAPNEGFRDTAFCGDGPVDPTDPGSCDASVAATIRINEVFVRPAGTNGANEFVELQGPPGASVSGYRLVSQSGAASGTKPWDIRLRGSFNDAGYFVVGGENVVGRDQDPGCTRGTGCIFNDGSNILLYACDGETLLDGLAWGGFSGDRVNRAGRGEPAPQPPEGFSLARCAGAETTDDNARDFGFAAPSPGSDNEGFRDAAFCGGGGPGPGCTLGRVPGLVINEVLIESPDSDLENEFIELRGPAGADLTGYRLVVQSGATTGTRSLSLVLNGAVGPTGKYVVGGSAVPGLDQHYGCTSSGGCITNNAGNNIFLLDCDGETVVDGVAYGAFDGRVNRVQRGDPAPLPPRGRTLARCPGAEDTSNNAADFGVASPTPGAPNGSFTDAAFCEGGGGDPDPNPTCTLGRVPGLVQAPRSRDHRIVEVLDRQRA